MTDNEKAAVEATTLEKAQAKVVDDLAALVWRLCATLRPGHPTRMQATQYLREHNLMAKPLRQDVQVTEPEAPAEGEFAPQAQVLIRQKGTEVQLLVQYDTDVFTVNPSNPEGEPQPDLTNPGVFFARWLEIHAGQLIGLSQGEFAMHQRVLMLTAAEAAKSALRKNLVIVPGSDGNPPRMQ